jgi:hypothetical protein
LARTTRFRRLFARPDVVVTRLSRLWRRSRQVKLTREREQCCRDSVAFARQLHAKGKYGALRATPSRYCNQHSPSRRKAAGNRPFAETREQLGGFFLIAAADLDQAIEIAGQLPAGRFGTVEIRLSWKFPASGYFGSPRCRSCAIVFDLVVQVFRNGGFWTERSSSPRARELEKELVTKS